MNHKMIGMTATPYVLHVPSINYNVAALFRVEDK
jgi:hypothetical protein